MVILLITLSLIGSNESFYHTNIVPYYDSFIIHKFVVNDKSFCYAKFILFF